MTAGPFVVIALIGAILVAVGLIGAKTLPLSENDMAPKELRQAALHVLNSQFRSSSVSVEIGSTNQNTVNRELDLIKKYKTWADTQDRDVRRAYYYWLDHFEGQAHSAQRAINNGAHEKWETKKRESWARYEKTKTFARTIPQPPHP